MPCTKYNILPIFYTLKWKQLNVWKGAAFRKNNLKLWKEYTKSCMVELLSKGETISSAWWNRFHGSIEPSLFPISTRICRAHCYSSGSYIPPPPLHILKIWTVLYNPIKYAKMYKKISGERIANMDQFFCSGLNPDRSILNLKNESFRNFIEWIGFSFVWPC